MATQARFFAALRMTALRVLQTVKLLRRYQVCGQDDVPRREMDMKIEIDREEDGRWIGEVPDLPGVLAYGASRDEAVVRTEALALRVIADRLDHGESISELDDLFAVPI
jgi:predicted RNase H-like HicB family nuclease